MNKYLIIPLLIASFVLGTAGIASATMMNGGVKTSFGLNTSGKNDNEMMMDSMTMAGVRSAYIAENGRCTALPTRDEVIACQAKIESVLVAKFPNIDKTIIARFLRVMLENQDKSGGEDNRGGMMNGERKDTKEMMEGKIKTFFGNLSARFDHVIKKLQAIHDRLSRVADRIDSRLEKLSSNDIDTSASVKFVTSAREELWLAMVATTDAETSFKAETSATTTINISNYKTALTKTLANIKTAKEHLIQAHKDLVQAIVNIKPGQNKIKATTTINVKTNI